MTLESMRFWQLGISFMLSWEATMMPSIFCFVWDTSLQSGGRKRYWMEMVRLVYDGKESGAFIAYPCLDTGTRSLFVRNLIGSSKENGNILDLFASSGPLRVFAGM